jgi:hypothetical protein
MCFYFKNQIIILIESHHAGIVIKDRDTPIPLAKRGTNFFGGSPDISLKEAIDYLSMPFLIKVLNPGVEDFMFAMLGPGLGDGF